MVQDPGICANEHTQIIEKKFFLKKHLFFHLLMHALIFVHALTVDGT